MQRKTSKIAPSKFGSRRSTTTLKSTSSRPPLSPRHSTSANHSTHDPNAQVLTQLSNNQSSTTSEGSSSQGPSCDRKSQHPIVDPAKVVALATTRNSFAIAAANNAALHAAGTSGMPGWLMSQSGLQGYKSGRGVSMTAHLQSQKGDDTRNLPTPPPMSFKYDHLLEQKHVKHISEKEFIRMHVEHAKEIIRAQLKKMQEKN